MKKVVLYGMKNCSHCDSARRYLTQQGIHFRYCDVQSPAGQKEFRRLGFRAVPIVKIADQYLQGFSAAGFMKLYR